MLRIDIDSFKWQVEGHVLSSLITTSVSKLPTGEWMTEWNLVKETNGEFVEIILVMETDVMMTKWVVDTFTLWKCGDRHKKYVWRDNYL